MSHLFIITGPRGSGKTTWCKDLLRIAVENGFSPQGFLSPAIFKNGEKIGIDLLVVQSGQQHPLARKRSGNTPGPLMGDWCFEPTSVELGNQILKSLTPQDLLILDELGPLELEKGEGFTEGLRLLDERRYQKAFVVIRPELVDAAKARWPEAEVLKAGSTQSILPFLKTNAIEINNLSVDYGDVTALRDITLEIDAGECILITGPSGCGKSTLAHVLSGLIPHAIPAQIEGDVYVAGMNVLVQTLPDIAQHVGMVFQNPASQLFHLRVEDEVAFGPRNLGLDENQVQERTEWALSATGLLALKDRNPAKLSGGQKQTLAIASVLAMHPQILVLDEPTASLDVPSTQKVMETLEHLQREFGITIVLIEHRLAEVIELVDRVILMDEGQILSDGTPTEVFANRQTRDQFGLRRLPEEPLTTWETLIQSDGHSVPATSPLLSLEKITAGYNGHPIIEEVDMTLYPGEFAALVGDNGVGKTTLALVAAGLLKPQRGKVCFHNGSKPRPGLDVALLFQNPTEQLFTDSVEQEVAFGPQNYGIHDATLHTQTLTKADLLELRHRRPITLSAGQQQRTALAACLSLRPQLLILDEPTLGQDWSHLQLLMDFLLSLNQGGTTILLISHDYKLVYRYTQRIFLMEAGRIIREGQLEKTHDEFQSLKPLAQGF
jgi:energy-coupling factor transporter ATP-binding protein EcfA2